MTPDAIDPNAWADAALRLFHGGGWVVPALLALWIVVRWWPWRPTKKGD